MSLLAFSQGFTSRSLTCRITISRRSMQMHFWVWIMCCKSCCSITTTLRLYLPPHWFLWRTCWSSIFPTIPLPIYSPKTLCRLCQRFSFPIHIRLALFLLAFVTLKYSNKDVYPLRYDFTSHVLKLLNLLCAYAYINLTPQISVLLIVYPLLRPWDLWGAKINLYKASVSTILAQFSGLNYTF